MAQPASYDRQASFSNEESLNPTTKTPGASLDAEFNAVKISLDQTQSNLSLLQRDDGALRNGSVGPDQLADSLSVGFTLRGAWEAPENYLTGDGVTYDSVFYRALASHVSVLGETPDTQPTLWLSVANFTDLAPAIIPDGSVTDVKLRNSAGVSVIGRAANSIGTPTDIVAGADNRVLQRKAGALVFDRIATDALEDSAVATAKIANGALSADTTGRAKVADGFLSADTAGRAKMADGFATPAKLDRVYAVPAYLAGHINGLTLANNGTDANNDIDIAAGVCVDDTGADIITLASAMTKRLDAAWAVGTAAGGLDTGSEANSTWYHLWAIKRTDTGVCDVLFSASATTPTMPASYDRKRRIGAVYNNSSGNIEAFVQHGDDFLWTVSPTPSTSSTGLISSGGTLFSLQAPTGVVVRVTVNFWFADGVSSQVYLSSPLAPDLAATATTGRADGLNAGSGGQKTLLTNTSGQIRARGSAGTSGQIYIATIGWRDPRGRA